MVVSGEKESAEETVRDNDGVLTTPPLLYISVEGLKESRHSVIHICTTKTERGREGEGEGEREREREEEERGRHKVGEERENEMNARGMIFLSLPLSCREAIEEGAHFSPLLAYGCHFRWILKVTPFLLTNTRLFTESNHLHETVAY